MAESGATMVEVGTTNKTHLADYEHALDTQHRAAAQGALEQLPRRRASPRRCRWPTSSHLGALHGVPVIEDQGCGVLLDLGRFGLPRRADRRAQSVAAGADRGHGVSGDKLLGGPQAGLIVGRQDVIAAVEEAPAGTRAAPRQDDARRARGDPARLPRRGAGAARDPDAAHAHDAASRDPRPRRGARRAASARCWATAADVAIADDTARAGGGALPLADIPSAVVTIAPRDTSRRQARGALRCGGEAAIVARVKDDRVLHRPAHPPLAAEEDAIVARLGEVLGE